MLILIFVLQIFLLLGLGQFQIIKVAHIEYTTADLPIGQMQAMASFKLAEKRLRNEKIIPNSITFSFAWQPTDIPEDSPAAAAYLYYVRNHSDWIFGSWNSNGKTSTRVQRFFLKFFCISKMKKKILK